MERFDVIEKLDELRELADKTNTGSNEVELDYKERIADWVLEVVENLRIGSVIHWVAVADKLPELKKNVLIFCKDGYVGWGMIAEQVFIERNRETGLYEQTKESRIEWGQEENDFEYWREIEDVILWAEFPKPPCV